MEEEEKRAFNKCLIFLFVANSRPNAQLQHICTECCRRERERERETKERASASRRFQLLLKERSLCYRRNDHRLVPSDVVAAVTE